MKKIILLILALHSLFLIAQNRKNYDIRFMDADIEIIPYQKKIKGIAKYDILLLKHVDSIVLDASDMKISRVKVGCFAKKIYRTDRYLIVKKKFIKGRHYMIKIKYEASPSKAMYFVGWKTNGRKEVWTQGQGKNNSHWLPVNDDMNDKFKWILKVKFNKDFQVISNGINYKIKLLKNGYKKYYFRMINPSPAYLMFIGAGKYNNNVITSESGVKIYNYFYSDKKKTNKTYFKSKEIFDFLEKEIGVKYPWINYKQIPVRDFLYGGMENVSATVFNDNRYDIDSIEFNDVNYINVQAHELTHQWFGDLVTGKNPKDHWLHEGFATYYASLNDKNIFGKAYNDYQIYKYDKQIIEMSKIDTIPIHSNNASSLSYYQKGARIVQMLRNRVGDKNFINIIHSFLNKYKFKNASIEDFKHEVFRQTGDSLRDFFYLWLETSHIPKIILEQKADKIIFKQNADSITIPFQFIYKNEKIVLYKNNTFLFPRKEGLLTVIANYNNYKLVDINFKRDKYYIENQIFKSDNFIDRYIALKLINNWDNKNLIYKKLLKEKHYYPIFMEILDNWDNQKHDDYILIIRELLKKDLKTRQYIAKKIKVVPEEIKKEYFELINDSSYITKSAVLWHYAISFPKDLFYILDKTKNIKGGNDKSFRQTWLMLALLSNKYSTKIKRELYKEMTHYTSADYNLNVRLNAFYALSELDLFNKESLKNLLDACFYFNWHLHKEARKILKKVYKNSRYKLIVENLVSDIREDRKKFIIDFLK